MLGHSTKDGSDLFVPEISEELNTAGVAAEGDGRTVAEDGLSRTCAHTKKLTEFFGRCLLRQESSVLLV